MTELLIRWLILAAALWITAAVLPGFKVRGPVGALVTAAVFGGLNWGVGWLLYVAIGLGTLGLGFLFGFLTRWLVNAIVLRLAAAITPRVEIQSFGWALAAALVVSGVDSIGHYLIYGPPR